MRHIVEILLLIGVLANLIKGADLILRPHQQKWVQSKFESLVLWFDYTKPFDWYVNREGAERVYQPQYAFMLPLVISFYLAIAINEFGWHWWAYLAILLLIVMGLRTLKRLRSGKRSAFTVLGFIDPELDEWFIGWLFGGKTLRQHVSRHLKVIAAGLVGLVVIVSTAFISRFSGYWLILRIAIQSVLSLLAFIPFLHGSMSLCIFVFALVFLVIELVLRVIRGFAWRIVEYNKGAFAALVLVATIALGLTELYLKFKSK